MNRDTQEERLLCEKGEFDALVFEYIRKILRKDGFKKAPRLVDTFIAR